MTNAEIPNRTYVSIIGIAKSINTVYRRCVRALCQRSTAFRTFIITATILVDLSTAVVCECAKVYF